MVNGKYLAHFGIPGMKWGQRRFQNEDGTYTEEGKRRRRLQIRSDDYNRTKNLRNRNPKNLSDKELKEVTARLNLENNYKNATRNGRNWAERILIGAGTAAATALASKAVNKGVEHLSSEALNIAASVLLVDSLLRTKP